MAKVSNVYNKTSLKTILLLVLLLVLLLWPPVVVVLGNNSGRLDRTNSIAADADGEEIAMELLLTMFTPYKSCFCHSHYRHHNFPCFYSRVERDSSSSSSFPCLLPPSPMDLPQASSFLVEFVTSSVHPCCCLSASPFLSSP